MSAPAITRLERIEQAQVETASEVRHISHALEQFIQTSEKRHVQTEREVDDLKSKQAESGKTNWPAIGVIASVVGGLAVLYVAPLRTGLEGIGQQLANDRAAAAADLRRIEETRRADNLDLDVRLQREMRLLTDTVNAKFDATKEATAGRLEIDERRVDDVTRRVDEWNTDERRELHQFWSGAARERSQK